MMGAPVPKPEKVYDLIQQHKADISKGPTKRSTTPKVSGNRGIICEMKPELSPRIPPQNYCVHHLELHKVCTSPASHKAQSF